MKKEHKNWFCFKKARWILAAAAALSLYPGSVFAEENIEVENTAAELSVEEGATPVPEKTETTEISEPQLQEQPTKKEPAETTETTETTEVTEEKKVQETAETPASTETVSSTEMVTPTEAVTPVETVPPTKAPEQVKTQRSAEKQEKSTPAKEKSVSDDSVETKSSAQIISVDITWGNMGFVYQKGLWNPETHQYGVGTWNPDGDGSSQISISNNGTESVKAFLTYTQVDTSYSGSFQNGTGENISAITLSAGENTSAYLVLAGTPSEEFSNNVLGTVTVTIGGQ